MSAQAQALLYSLHEFDYLILLWHTTIYVNKYKEIYNFELVYRSCIESDLSVSLLFIFKLKSE